MAFDMMDGISMMKDPGTGKFKSLKYFRNGKIYKSSKREYLEIYCHLGKGRRGTLFQSTPLLPARAWRLIS